MQTFVDSLLECIYRGEAVVSQNNDMSSSHSNTIDNHQDDVEEAVVAAAPPTPNNTSYWSRITGYFGTTYDETENQVCHFQICFCFLL